MVKYLSLALMMLVFFSCEKDDKACLPVSNELLQGKWEDYCNECHAFGSRAYNFEFVDDSFKMHKLYITDALNTDCDNNSSWNIYVKGISTFKNGELYLDGYYCDENYNKLTYSPCPEVIDTGAFEMQFNSVKYCNDTLILQDTELSDWQGLIKLKKSSIQ